ncbi:unnamed protein product [Polarella glacialis]|uniref:Uncharacterized protein n=1 Tax=Polarella glacialis TaxID=89957 RepID=A0A813HEU9_POLGL|nr:unnamed protein product [Polarella glacialis]
MARPSSQAVCLVSACLAGASVILVASALLARRKRAGHCVDHHYSAKAQLTADPDVGGLSGGIAPQVPPPVSASGSMPSCAERCRAIEFWIGRAFWRSIGEEAASEVTSHIWDLLDEEAGARRAIREAAVQVDMIVLHLARVVAIGELQNVRALASLPGARQHLEEVTACMGDELWLKARLGPIQMFSSAFSAFEHQKLLSDRDVGALPFPGQQLAEAAERLRTATAFVLLEIWEEDEAARMERMEQNGSGQKRTRRP